MTVKTLIKSTFGTKLLFLLILFSALFAFLYFSDSKSKPVNQTGVASESKTYSGTNSYDKSIHFSLEYPPSCNTKQVSYSSEYEPTLIICLNQQVQIIPGAGGRGLGDNPQSKITRTSDDIILGKSNWTRTIFRDANNPENIIVTYVLKDDKIHLFNEVNYLSSSYSVKNQDFVEKILSTFKFTD